PRHARISPTAAPSAYHARRAYAESAAGPGSPPVPARTAGSERSSAIAPDIVGCRRSAHERSDSGPGELSPTTASPARTPVAEFRAPAWRARPECARCDNAPTPPDRALETATVP